LSFQRLCGVCFKMKRCPLQIYMYMYILKACCLRSWRKGSSGPVAFFGFSTFTPVPWNSNINTPTLLTVAWFTYFTWNDQFIKLRKLTILLEHYTYKTSQVSKTSQLQNVRRHNVSVTKRPSYNTSKARNHPNYETAPYIKHTELQNVQL
jgi:hypothetical protein